MTEESKEQLHRLARLSAEDIGGNENNVKYKFIIPFLKAFGYNEEVDFEHSAQGSRIDILIHSTSHNKILVEAKNYLNGKKLTSKKINQHISQAIQYYDKLKSLKQGIDNQVFLVIFYNGSSYPVCKESVLMNGVFVYIVFIYLGSKTPHEKRSDLYLQIDIHK